MQFFGSNTHFLAEKFSQFMGDKGIVHTDGTALSTSAANGASIGKFRQAGNGFPIQIDIVTGKLCKGFASPFQVFIYNLAEYLRSIGGTVDFLPPARNIDRTGIIAGLTFGAILESQHQGHKKSPVILLREKLF
jgi:hypothetical protein